jgi:DNA-binding NarL/FixJ family response regulator
MSIKVGIVDDHQLFRKSLRLLVTNFADVEVHLDAQDGIDLQQKIKQVSEPLDMMLIDVEMPNMNGPETAKWLHTNYPSIKLIALSMNENEEIVLRMIKAGCCTYLLKDTAPDELERAIQTVYKHGYYNSEISNSTLGQLLLQRNNDGVNISEKEKEFVQLATSDQTYKQIADIMKVSERTVDGYRGSLFSKLQVQSRTGMVLEAIRRGLVKI